HALSAHREPPTRRADCYRRAPFPAAAGRRRGSARAVAAPRHRTPPAGGDSPRTGAIGVADTREAAAIRRNRRLPPDGPAPAAPPASRKSLRRTPPCGHTPALAAAAGCSRAPRASAAAPPGRLRNLPGPPP